MRGCAPPGPRRGVPAFPRLTTHLGPIPVPTRRPEGLPRDPIKAARRARRAPRLRLRDWFLRLGAEWGGRTCVISGGGGLRGGAGTSRVGPPGARRRCGAGGARRGVFISGGASPLPWGRQAGVGDVRAMDTCDLFSSCRKGDVGRVR